MVRDLRVQTVLAAEMFHIRLSRRTNLIAAAERGAETRAAVRLIVQ